MDAEEKNMGKATIEEVTEFQQIERNRKQIAQQEKADILTRLKKQDQTVPISFFTNESNVEGNSNA